MNIFLHFLTFFIILLIPASPASDLNVPGRTSIWTFHRGKDPPELKLIGTSPTISISDYSQPSRRRQQNQQYQQQHHQQNLQIVQNVQRPSWNYKKPPKIQPVTPQSYPPVGWNSDSCTDCTAPPCGPFIIYKDREKIVQTLGPNEVVTLVKEKVTGVPGQIIKLNQIKETVEVREVPERVVKKVQIYRDKIVYKKVKKIVYKDIPVIKERRVPLNVILREEEPLVDFVPEEVRQYVNLTEERIQFHDEPQEAVEIEEILKKEPQPFDVSCREDDVSIEWAPKLEKVFCNVGHRPVRPPPCKPGATYLPATNCPVCPVCSSCPDDDQSGGGGGGGGGEENNYSGRWDEND